LALFAVMVTPLVAWLWSDGFGPFKYAAQRSHMRGVQFLPLFLLSDIANIAGVFLLAAAVGLIGWRRSSAVPLETCPINADAMRFLAIFGLGPIILTFLFALVVRSGLRGAWASSMFHFSGLLLVAYCSDRLTSEVRRRLAVATALVLSIVPASYAAFVLLSPRFAKAPLRVNWPQAEIARRLGAIWARETGLPLRIVTGETWVASLVGATAKDSPSLLGRWDPATTPWVTPARIAREGMLIVWDGTKRPFGMEPYLKDQSIGQERFVVPHAKRDIIIDYAIIKPKSAAR
jgi:hypothetical protein